MVGETWLKISLEPGSLRLHYVTLHDVAGSPPRKALNNPRAAALEGFGHSHTPRRTSGEAEARLRAALRPAARYRTIRVSRKIL